MMATPDELQADIYKEHIHDHLRDGAVIAFAHGLSIHFGLIEPKKTVDVVMIAPKGPGHTVRNEYQKWLWCSLFNCCCTRCFRACP